MIKFTLNGSQVNVSGENPADSLLNVLRDELHVYSAKNACTQGECGSCAIVVDGRVICSCLMPICAAEGADVRTVEGFSNDPVTKAVQDALATHGAVQCGFCIPGVVVSASMLLKTHRSLSRDQIRHALAGNLCRCTGYTKIVDSVESVNRELEGLATAGISNGDEGSHLHDEA